MAITSRDYDGNEQEEFPNEELQSHEQKELDLAQQVYREFQTSTAFIDGLNLRKDISRCVNFEQGVQWNMDDDLRDFPKVTLNIVRQIGKVRKSSILQNEYGYLVNSTRHDAIRKVQDFLKYLSNKMRLKKKDLKVVNDTFTKGTGILYFYWDADTKDLLSRSGGRLRSEVVDVRRFRVADPFIPEVQSQEYVMYVTRERISAIKRKYGVKVESDAEEYTNLTEKPVSAEEPEDEFANVYTKFYRNHEGQVFFVITTARHVLKQPTAMNYHYKGDPTPRSSHMRVMDETERHSEDKKEDLEVEEFGLYPFASLVLDERDNHFYGVPGALEVLESQKSINQHFSVYDKGVQDNVLGGYVYKRGILGDQEITTENGQIIELELLPGEQIDSVFRRMPTNNVPADSLNYSGNLLGVLREVAGASNVQIGKADYAGQSGKATEVLMQRARENSTDYAMLFNEYKKDQAEIMFLFAKFFYDNESFAVVEHGFKRDNVRKYEDENKFNGNDYLGEEFLFDIQVGPAPSFSEYANIELLGMMVQSGQVPAEVYVAGLPEGQVSNKDELLEMMKSNSQKVIEDLQQQLQQAGQVMEQMNEAFVKMQKDVENVHILVRENERVKSMLGEIAAQSVKVSEEAAKDNQQLTQDVQDLLQSISLYANTEN